MGDSTAVDRAQYHAWFHHNDSDGWITIAKKTENGTFKQYHYQPNELASELTNWLGEDVFFSQNTFYKPQRAIQNIRQLRSLYIDLDFYLFNYDMSWVIGKLEHEHYGKDIPEPNILIFSGQGLVLIWLLDPVPYKALPLWQTVQNYFLATLTDLGGDPKASDAARIFRIAGSVNAKNGAEVRAEYRHDHRYELRQIQYDYLPELNDEISRPATKRKGRKKKVANLFNKYQLHYARLMDLVKLVELRGYEVTGQRETICFLYRYWLCCYSNDTEEALNQTVAFNLQFSTPLPTKEVERATRSAQKAWEASNNEEANRLAIEKGYPGAGYNISNKKLIEWLDITEIEQQKLKTIIDANEKRRRKRIANMEMRRSQGVIAREVYLKEQNKKTMNSMTQIKRVQEDNPGASMREIARVTGFSIGYVHKLINNL